MTNFKHLISSGAALALMLGAPSAHAATFAEVGDAGQLPGTAQFIGAADAILGGLSSSTDVDLYAFIWGGGVLTMDTFAPPNLSDPQLHLFDAAGMGIGENDDAVGFQSEISLNLAGGSYFLGISSFDNDAIDAALLQIFGFGDAFLDLKGNQIQAPRGVGPLAGWNNNTSHAPGNYQITFSSTTSPIPEPTGVLLFSVGMLVVGRTLRRRAA